MRQCVETPKATRGGRKMEKGRHPLPAHQSSAGRQRFLVKFQLQKRVRQQQFELSVQKALEL